MIVSNELESNTNLNIWYICFSPINYYIYKSKKKKKTTVDVLKLNPTITGLEKFNPTITACLIPYIREEDNSITSKKSE